MTRITGNLIAALGWASRRAQTHMILSNARLVVVLSGPDLVLLSVLQPGERREPLWGQQLEGQSASWGAQPLHLRHRAIYGYYGYYGYPAYGYPAYGYPGYAQSSYGYPGYSGSPAYSGSPGYGYPPIPVPRALDIRAARYILPTSVPVMDTPRVKRHPELIPWRHEELTPRTDLTVVPSADGAGRPRSP